MKKLTAILAVISLVCTVALTGCSNAPANQAGEDGKPSGKVVFWHTYSDVEEKILLENVIPKFKKLYPEINVEAVRMPIEGLKQQLITAISGNVAPDVMRLDIIWTPELAKMGALEKLDVKDTFDELKKSVFPGPLQTCEFEGSYYGLPLNTNTKIAIWNKALLKECGLKEPPKTWDEFEKAAKKVTDKKNVWGYGMGSPECWNFVPIFQSMGGQITNDDETKGSGFINSDKAVEIVEKMVEWYDIGLLGPTIFSEEPGSWGGIANGNYLMVEDGPWYFNLAEDTQNVVPSLYPAGDGGSVNVVGGENIVNFSSSKNKEASWAFTKFMLSDETQLTLVDAGIIPAKSTVVNDPKLVGNDIYQIYFKQLETAAPRTVNPNFNKINEEVRLYIEKALRKDGEVRTLLNELAISIDKALS